MLVTAFVKAQTATVRGFVYSKENGEPVLFNVVFLKGTNYNASTDDNGFFNISKIPPGTYTIVVGSMDSDTITEVLTLKAGDLINKKYLLEKRVVEIDEVTVSAEDESKVEDTKVSVYKIDPKMINKLPSVGEPDLAQYLQVLPGVTFTGDQGGQLYIRGGAPSMNKVLLDGMIVYNPFHSIGLFSVFDNDIIRNADVYSAGFGAEYGGRISSVMDIKTRDGNKTRYSGKVSASPFGAKVNLEGPLKKLRDDGKGSSAFLLSAKTSYLPTTSKMVYKYADPNGLPFSFNDYYGKVSFNSNSGSKLNLFGFSFNDKVDYPDIAKFNWKSLGAGANFVVIPTGANTLIEGNFAYSRYNITAKSVSDSGRTSFAGSFNLGLNFTNFIGKNEIQYGFEGIGLATKYELRNITNLLVTDENNSTEVGAYVKGKYASKNKKLILEPSFRLQYYASLSDLSPEPRLSGKFNVTPRHRLKFAAGLYSQNLIAANSDRDIVNLFYGFLSSPESLQDNFTKKDGSTKPVTHALQKASHLVAGYEFDLGKHVEINIEGYQKYFSQLTSINRDKIFEDDAAHANNSDVEKKLLIVETGTARGLDIVLKYDIKKFYFWFVYSLAYNKRWDGIREYAPVFDRRHNINVVASYNFGKHKEWELGARFNFGTGFPFTPTAGFYPGINFQNNINYNYSTSNANLSYIPGDLNSRRLPVYDRMDVNLKYKTKLREHLDFEGTLGATNAYNQNNIFYYDRITARVKKQLPIMPNINLSLSF